MPWLIRAACTLLALTLLGAPTSLAQQFYTPQPDPIQESSRTLAKQDQAHRERIKVARERIRVREEKQQSSTRLTDRDAAVGKRRYGNAIPNKKNDAQSTTIQSTGNRSLLVPQR